VKILILLVTFEPSYRYRDYCYGCNSRYFICLVIYLSNVLFYLSSFYLGKHYFYLVKSYFKNLVFT